MGSGWSSWRAVHDANRVASAIGRALGIGERPGRPIEEALAVNVGVGSLAARAHGHLYLSYSASRRGDVAAERDNLVESLAAMQRMGGAVEEPDWLWASASLAMAEGRLATGLRLAGAADTMSRRTGSYLNEQFLVFLEPMVDEVRLTVGPERADRLQAEGSRMPLDELMAEALAEPDPGDDDEGPLSRREREVAALVGEGLTNQEIADRLFISKRTVESHVVHIKQKLDHDNRTQIIAWALQEFGAAPR